MPRDPIFPGLAGATLLAALLFRFWTPRAAVTSASLAVYALLVASAGYLIYRSNAPALFGGLMFGLVLFAGYLGASGLLVVLAAAIGVITGRYLAGDTLAALLQGAVSWFLLPSIISVILWSKDPAKASEDTAEDKTYHELASQLSRVSGKSDVVINAIADGVLALNTKGQIELINPAAQNIIGWGKQDALDLDYKSVLKLVDNKNAEVDDINHPVEKALHENTAQSSDVYSLVTSSGKNVLISIVVSPIGQPGSGVIVVFRDITAEKAEEREQAEFISTASHEMRTPVASIEGYLGLALNPATATIDEKARDYILKAHEAAQHLGRLFQDLLDVSKADDGRLKNNPKAVDVVPFVNDIALGLKSKADEKGLRFIFKPNPDNEQPGSKSLSPVFYANVDNDHLREVVANLIENAIKYTLQGEVVIDVTGTNDKVTVSVADTGIGIPKEDQGHLFQKFYRVDNSDTREIGGTGLGLYLSRRLSEAIGGRLWAESEYKKGSTFFLELPRISHEEATRLIEETSIQAEREAAQAAATPAPEIPLAAPAPVTPVAQPAARVMPAPAPATAPTVPPNPVPPTPAAPPAPQPARQNTPLSAIEANPRSFVQQRSAALNIPERRQ